MAVKSQADFIRVISQELGLAESRVEELLDIGEAKDGWFYACKKPGKWLSTEEFKAMCRLARSLGGEYVNTEQTWRVPGPMAQQPQPETAGPEPAEPSPGALTWIPINKLVSLPFQIRVDMAGLEELAESIRTYGVLEPILVRPSPSGVNYQIVAGERRVRAAALAGLDKVPCVIRQLSDEEAYTVMLTENIQRENLSDYEIACGLEYLVNRFGYTQEQLAQKLGKTQGWVSRHLRILKLEKDYNIPRGILEKITEGQARAILSLPEERRREVLARISQTGEIPSMRQIEAEKPGPEPGAEIPAEPQEQLDTTTELLEPGQPSEAPAPPAPQQHDDYTGAPPGPPEPSTASEPEPLLTGFEVVCPECGKRLILNHVDLPGGGCKHVLEEVAGS